MYTYIHSHDCVLHAVAFSIYDIDQDGFISNGELFQVLKTMVGNNLTDKQLQEIVDKTILYADKDGDGKISFEEFCDVSVLLSGLKMLRMLLLYIMLIHVHYTWICTQKVLYEFSTLEIKLLCVVDGD